MVRSMGLIHTPNTRHWSVGDFVVHDADAKRVDMLMVVTGCGRDGLYRTRYAFPDQQPHSWRRRVWRNALAALHDPGRFGIEVPQRVVTPAR
jgi:hypothetical protein